MKEKLNQKTLELVEGIAYGNFLGEDSYSRDYCIYCNFQYGNYEKFGYSKRTLEENHEKDCFYRLANEVLETTKEIMEKDNSKVETLILRRKDFNEYAKNLFKDVAISKLKTTRELTFDFFNIDMQTFETSSLVLFIDEDGETHVLKNRYGNTGIVS